MEDEQKGKVSACVIRGVNEGEGVTRLCCERKRRKSVRLGTMGEKKRG